MTTILSPNQLLSLFPQVSDKTDAERLQRFIEESEFEYVKEKISDSLYIDILAYVDSADKTGFPVEYATLLEGGIFEEKTACCGNDVRKRIFKGLYATIGYYSFAKLVAKNSANVTRYGFTNKSEEHSSQIELKERVNNERKSLQTADVYMADCIAYIEANRDKITQYSHPQPFKSRLQIIVLK